MSYKISFDYPEWMLLLPIAILIVLIYKFILRKEIKTSLFRLLALAAILLALSQPKINQILNASNSIQILVDLSDSINITAIQNELSQITTELSKENANYVVNAFGLKDGIKLIDQTEAQDLQNYQERVGPGESNLSLALDETINLGASQIILLTDGIETNGDIEAAIPKIKKSGTKIYSYLNPSFRKTKNELEIESLHLPLYTQAGESIRGHASLYSSINNNVSGKILIYVNDKLAKDEQVTVEPNKRLIHDIELLPSSEETTKVEIKFRPDDQQIKESKKTWFIYSQQGKKVLLISGTTQDSKYLKVALERSRVQLESFIQGQSIKFNDLKKFQSVIINNIKHSDLPLVVQNEAEDFAASGGRLVFIGGERGFGLGGYVGKDIDKLSPLRSIEPRSQLKRVNAGVQLVIDKSKSMQFGDRMEYAKQAAREVVRSLEGEDYAGIIGYDSTPFIVFPIRKMAEYRAMAIQRIGSMYPTGQTFLYPALDEARRGLINTPAGRKHIIVMTDGRLPDGGPQYLQLVQQIRLHGISVSTVLLGGDSDTSLLRSMAQYGGGSFYQTNDPRSLPKIFLQDVKVATKEQTMKENQNFAVRKSQTIKTPLTAIERFPDLYGYVETEERTDSSLDLVISSAGVARPLLASRKIGSGTVVAYASDANGRWSREWINWQNYERFWREIITGSEEKESNDSLSELSYDLKWRLKGDQLLIDIVVFDQLPTSDLSLSARQGESLDSKELAIDNVAEGRFLATLDKPMPGIINIAGKIADKKIGPIAIELAEELFADNRGKQFQTNLLSKLSIETGGEINSIPKKTTTQTNDKVSYKIIDPYWFLPFIFTLLLLDVIVRIPRFKKR